MTKLFFLAPLLGSFLFACAAVPADARDEQQGATSSEQRSAPLEEGSAYELVEKTGLTKTTTSLVVTNLEDESLDITVTKVDGDGIRQVQKVSAYGEHGTWTYDDGASCQVTLRFSANWSSVTASELGSFDCNFVDHIDMKNLRFFRDPK